MEHKSLVVKYVCVSVNSHVTLKIMASILLFQATLSEVDVDIMEEKVQIYFK